MKRNQAAAAFLAILLFFSGVAVGALAHLYYTKSTVSAKTTAEDFRQQYISEMRSRLNLSPAQLNQLEGILDETKAKVKAVRDLYHPQMLRIKAEQIDRVKSILTPAQIPAYEKLVAERERRAKELEERDAASHHHARAE
jgi:hypothetical protein